MKLNFGKAFTTLVPSLWEGVGIVIYITLAGFTLALVVALVIAIGRLSKNRLLSGFLGITIELVRGTPLLVQLFYIYFVIPILLNGFYQYLVFRQI